MSVHLGFVLLNVARLINKRMTNVGWHFFVKMYSSNKTAQFNIDIYFYCFKMIAVNY